MAQISFLDGGLGQEINTRSSAEKSHPLWSIKVMQEEPDIIVDVHQDFINSGARTITINTYTATPTRLTRHHHIEHFTAFHHMAITLAEKAIAQSNSARDEITLAGCLPPLAASYVAEEALDYEASVDEFHAIIDAGKGGVDIFMAETMSNITEAKAAVHALKSSGFDSYVSLTLSDNCNNTLRSGEPLEQAIDELGALGLAALNLNCSFPEAIDKAMPLLGRSGIKCGAYANGFTSIEALAPGTTVDNLTARQDLSKTVYSTHVDRWIADGATIIGGCCEIGPDYIAHLKTHLEAQGHNLVKL